MALCISRKNLECLDVCTGKQDKNTEEEHILHVIYILSGVIFDLWTSTAIFLVPEEYLKYSS